MRLTISKQQHRSLLLNLAAQLGSDKPIDGLEHILNCWMVGNVPPSPISPAPKTAAAIEEDEFAGLDSL